MPKLKTHKGLRARARVTRRGKVVRRKAGKSHLMSAKSSKRRRHLRRVTAIEGRVARIVVQRLSSG